MTDKHFGPKTQESKIVHAEKYRQRGESFEDAMYRIASELKEDTAHYHTVKDILLYQRFLPAGRIQSAVGASRETTPFNCYVSRTIDDSMEGIMKALAEAAQTMRMGGGIGFDFSTLRPKGARIKSLDSTSSGPLSFMEIFNSMCGTIMSAGHRRGAMMGVMRIDHPDIEEFITAKHTPGRLTNFNLSVAVTDEFMNAVKNDMFFELKFNGEVYNIVKARKLWDLIMRSTWDYAEPGVLFIDRINKKNNLSYLETIATTNPCSEQPLPPYGACLLGSFNLVKYVIFSDGNLSAPRFDWNTFEADIRAIVPAIDNVIDKALYPLPEQAEEARSKRRMGLGITGLANAIAMMGYQYGDEDSHRFVRDVMTSLRDTTYRTSIELAIKKGPFPLFDAEEYLKSDFAKTLPEDIRCDIEKHGIRNSHLLSIAPTGTISFTADNISSGIEPAFSKVHERQINFADGPRVVTIKDYVYREFGDKITQVYADELSVEAHVDMLNLCSAYVDSACSKTCNVGADVSWERFKDAYMRAYDGGSSGCTTFRAAGKRYGIINKIDEVEETLDKEGAACYIDPATGKRTCE